MVDALSEMESLGVHANENPAPIIKTSTVHPNNRSLGSLTKSSQNPLSKNPFENLLILDLNTIQNLFSLEFNQLSFWKWGSSNGSLFHSTF